MIQTTKPGGVESIATSGFAIETRGHINVSLPKCSIINLEWH
jgi:hypothetical protein